MTNEDFEKKLKERWDSPEFKRGARWAREETLKEVDEFMNTQETEAFYAWAEKKKELLEGKK